MWPTAETVDGIFAWIPETVADAGYLSPKAVFIDGTHIKANANTKKQVKAVIPVTAKRYATELMEEVNTDREAHSKKPFDDKRVLSTAHKHPQTMKGGHEWITRSWRRMHAIHPYQELYRRR